MAAAVAAFIRARRGTGILAYNIGCDRVSAGVASAAFQSARTFCYGIGADWIAGGDSGIGSGHRADQSGGDRFIWAKAAAASGSSQWNSRSFADDGGGSNAAFFGGRNSGAS